ncbi:MAG: hypothetical protein R3F43_06595 [bacterium]
MIFNEDHLAVGDTVLQLRGPAPTRAPGWTPLEKLVLLALVGALGALAWAWLGQ